MTKTDPSKLICKNCVRLRMWEHTIAGGKSYGGSCLVKEAPSDQQTPADQSDQLVFSAPGWAKWKITENRWFPVLRSFNTFFELISNLRFATTATINSDLTDYYLQSAYLNWTHSLHFSSNQWYEMFWQPVVITIITAAMVSRWHFWNNPGVDIRSH